jgi:hypothetical protein
MKRIWIPLCLLLGFAMLLYNLYFWGGVASGPEVGPMFRERASSYSFLAWMYISAGQGCLDLLGWQESAAQFVSARMGYLYESMAASPGTAFDKLFKNISMMTTVSYYGAPLLLLMGAFAQTRKPKQFSTFSKR